jgi:1-acyl-sn-glycerol-3-phosphate acyltransferase
MHQSLKQCDTPALQQEGARERELLAVIGGLVRELHPGRSRFIEISPSSRLERDLGIDSLARTELMLRVERAFRVRLPITVIGEAETVADLLHALASSPAQRVFDQAKTAVAPELPLVPAAVEARTLVEVLDWHVAQHPDRIHLTLLQDDATVLGTMTYADLAKSARAVAAGLVASDILPGDRVALMLPTGLDFFAAFFGVLYAGAVPVPIYPPMRLSQIEDHLRRQARILRNAGARMLITVPEGRRFGTLLRGHAESLGAIESVANLKSASPTHLPPITDPASTALIQYTSGSTGDPKGVVLSHANLLANIRAMGRAMEASSADVFVSWLPLYHDMGLIGAWLGCLYFAASLYVMSPLSFLVRPESWLWAIHRFRATLSAAPNFAFELCLNKIDEADLQGLDLGSLRMVANGAEPVSIESMRRFIARFERYGFRPEAMAPVYGLAESAVGLAFPPPGRGPIIDRVDREALSRRGIAESAKPDDPRPLELVACGHPLADHEIRIVDEVGQEVGERREGSLEFRAPSATSGYFRNEAKTRELFHHGWLDSGDRAYMAGGDVYITGRVKDIIIRAGQHIYPQEIEEAISEIPGIRKGCVAVFGVTDQASGTERVVVVAETRATDAAARVTLQSRAYQVATDVAGAPPDEIVLAPPRTVPKTSSGKIRRSVAKQMYETGRIGGRTAPVWWQLLRLASGSSIARIARLARVVAKLGYATWWWLVVGLSTTIGWLAVLILPNLVWRWAVVRALGRAALAAIGAPVSVNGLERIPRSNAMLVFNHSSYADALVLAAVLPGEPTFVAKKELTQQFFAGLVLRRLGTLFVERYNVADSRADAQVVIAAARQGHVLVFFPEGTFTRRAGLAGFFLGAFTVATEADLPVVPGVIRGTRSMLRGDRWFPGRSSLSVEILEPIAPTGVDFASVLRLRDATRAAMLARCGEPDLDELTKPASSGN